MEITIVPAGNEHLFIQLAGNFTIEEGVLLKGKLKDYLTQGYRYLIADFTDVDYIDSFGLGILVHIQRFAEKQNGHFVVENVNPSLETFFKLTTLTAIPVK
ncbi:STAS domain-containing protein [Niallia taxi]|uniref:STAS domain-containing protein n=1 Tax=Niallia taxi TaxID=2499688 RepID=UPI0015F376F5|nr:STAS domain-containing protein [Niallia taxi]